MLENWPKTGKVGNNNQKLKELIIKDHILSAVPSRVATFLMEQRAGDLRDLESKGTTYYDANKDIFAGGMQPEFNIGAAALWHNKQAQPKFKLRYKLWGEKTCILER